MMSKDGQNQNAGSGQSNAMNQNVKAPINQNVPTAPQAPAVVPEDAIQKAIAGLREEIREVLTVLSRRIAVLEKLSGADNRGVVPSTVRNENTDPGPWAKDARPLNGFREQ
jgi:hypothetical protein